jgi:hypothetical protein
MNTPEEHLDTDEEIKAFLLAKHIVDKVIEEKISVNVAQSAFASAWITTCRAGKAPPEIFEAMAKSLIELYKITWESESDPPKATQADIRCQSYEGCEPASSYQTWSPHEKPAN